MTRLTPRQHQRAWATRIVVAVCVFAGSLAIPLGFEILWRFDGVAGSHLQPEVTAVEVGGQDLVRGQDPYHPSGAPATTRCQYHPPGEPDFAGFLPYLPLMAVAGIPSEIWPNNGLSDARIFFCLTTLAVAAVALYLCRADGRTQDPRRSGADHPPAGRRCPLATGGDDIPVVAFLLLAVVLAQRRRPFASGVVFGIASAMKFTAWPLAVLALFAARGRNGERRPFAHAGRHDRRGRPDDLPLRAARPLRPHRRRRALPARPERHSDHGGQRAARVTCSSAHSRRSAAPCRSSVGIVLAVLLARHLYRHTPRTASEVCMISGVVMSALILLAPDPRVGYLLYPINFFVWAYLFAEPATPSETSARRRRRTAGAERAGQPGD